LRLIARPCVADDGEGDDRFGAILVLRRRDEWERQERQREDDRCEIRGSGSSDCHYCCLPFDFGFYQRLALGTVRGA
jgi:hypothetical protein